MRLLDLIAQKRALRVQDGAGRELPGAGAFRGVIAQCPLRYVLADDLVACATHLAFAEGDRLISCLDLIRVPSQSLWIEWSEAPRMAALAAVPALALLPTGDAKRAGALIQADRTGRSGSIRTFWSTADDVALLSPLVIHFDFDGVPNVAVPPSGGWLPGSVTLSLAGEPAVEELLAHFRCVIDPQWALYYHNARVPPELRPQALRSMLGGSAFDGPMLCAFFLLLGARGLLPCRHVTHEKLNSARGRAGRAPLMEHIEVFAPLGEAPPPPNEPTEAVQGRSAPRLHHVRGHIVRRGLSVFWRSPHLRGSARLGQVRTRTVELSFARH